MAVGDPWPGWGQQYTYTYVQQGWQCPVCKSVWAPFMVSCCVCPSVTVTVTSGGANDSAPDDSDAQEATLADTPDVACPEVQDPAP